MLEKNDKTKTIVFRSDLAQRDSQAFSKSPSKPASATKKQPEPDPVEDAFFSLADRMGDQNSKPASQKRERDGDRSSWGAEKLLKELHLHSQRATDSSKSSRLKKSFRKTRENKKKAA